MTRTLGELPLIVELLNPDTDRRALDTTEELVAEVIECDSDGAIAHDVARGVSSHAAVSMEPRQRRSSSQSRASSASLGFRIGRRSDPDDGRSRCSVFSEASENLFAVQHGFETVAGRLRCTSLTPSQSSSSGVRIGRRSESEGSRRSVRGAWALTDVGDDDVVVGRGSEMQGLRGRPSSVARSASSSSGFRIGRRSDSKRSRSPLPDLLGSSSDEGVVVGRRREVGSGAAHRAARAQDSREFQPDEVDATRCQALLLNRGRGKLQCRGKPVRGSDLCAKHSRRLLWGKVTGALSQEALAKFWGARLKRQP